jgi:adenylosuccinate lyase
MTNPNDTYTSPLATRNASPEMLRLWSPRHKFNTWRRIWLAVAEAQHEVTKDWGSERAPTVREGSSSQGGKPLPHGRGSSGSRGGPLVTREQVEALRAVVERVNDDGTVGITDAEIARAADLEQELRHDVMSHVHCLGESCPEAKGIIHLGCTSQDVVCNADLMTIRAAHDLVERKLARCAVALAESAHAHASIPTLGFTHYQPAQPTTVGRRLAEYSYNLTLALDRDTHGMPSLLARGFRGATGTQASFLQLFEGRADDVDEFEYRALAALPGSMYVPPLMSESEAERSRQDAVDAAEFELNTLREMLQKRIRNQEGLVARLKSMSGDEYRREGLAFYRSQITFRLTGQTYPRVVDAIQIAQLASIAAVLHKIATDIRLLSNRKEIDEPFGSKQIGSSAMPYKRNPMRCERICGLTRFVMNLVGNAYDTAATQWLERTLDDSSNRRLSLPEAFLALDGALDLMHNVASGLVVHEAMVRKNLMLELPFLATENILMEAVKAGGDRQDLHERIRVHAQEAGHRVKHLGLDNNLIDLLKADPAFAAVHDRLTDADLLDPMKYVGRSVEQTERFIAEVIGPLRERYKDVLEGAGDSEPRV